MTVRVDPVLSPAYLIRSYAWELLKTNMGDVWDEDKYDGMVPIVPVAEEPELAEFSGPHIVWGYALDATGTLYARNSGSLTFAIYDQDFRRLTKTLIILQTAFERQDEAARDVNAFTSRYNPTNRTTPPYLGIRFGTIGLGFVEGGTPEDTEGGRQSALININFEYYVDYNVVTEI